MVFWISALLMVTLAILCVLLPLAKKPGEPEIYDRSLDIYREQLAEIEKRIKKGTGNTEALQQERAEVARRLLKLERPVRKSKVSKQGSGISAKITSIAALLFIPLSTAALYASYGSPNLPDQPLSARKSDRLEDKSVNEMVQLAERHLVKNPDDVRGWEVLANIYGRTNRASDRANALREVIRLKGETPALSTELAEALTIANGGIVSAQAAELFQKTLASEPQNLKARVFLANAAEQDGNFADAIERWEELAQSGPDEDRWRGITTQRIAALQGRLSSQSGSGPSQSDVENAAAMSTEDRQEMISGMVSRLEERLQETPDDVEGWQRLIRSRLVLNQKVKAAVALQQARLHFEPGSVQRSQLENFAKGLSMETEAVN